jgi:glycosyltransferase involved in cell wall biosynthesis
MPEAAGRRIGLLLGRLAVGGAERQFVLLARGLAARGHSVRFFTVSPGGALADELEGVPGVSLRPLLRAGEGGRAALLRLPRRLDAALREEPLDVLHSALYLTNALAAWCAPRRGVPVVWGVRNTRAHGGWKAGLVFRLGRARSGRVAALISNSAAGLAWHRAAGYGPARGEVVPNGIDGQRFRPDDDRRRAFRAELGLSEEHCLVGLVGRLSAAKNHALFLRAAQLAAAEDPRLRFVAAAPDAECVPEELRALAAGLGDRFRWVGAGGRAEEVYPGLDLLALPSTVEGFPNVVGEAMACGVPCLVSGAGDSAELVGDAGEVLRDGSPADWARALLALAADRAELAARGRRSLARVATEYPVERMVASTERILVEVARGSAGA